MKVPIFSGFPVENPTEKANRLKALLRRISLSECGSERFRVRLKRLCKFGSVAYLVERPKRETRAEVLGHRPIEAILIAMLLVVCDVTVLLRFQIVAIAIFSRAGRRRGSNGVSRSGICLLSW